MVNLKDVELLSSLTEQELAFLESVSQKRSLKSGEDLFEIGEEAQAFYILLEGKLQAYISDEIILGEIEAEDIVGEMGLFSDRKTRMSSVRALENSVLIIILPFALDSIKQNHPEIIGKISNVIEERKKLNRTKI